MEDREFLFSGSPENFCQAIIAMKRKKLLDETGAGLDSPRKKRVIDRRGTSIYYEALGRDGTTLLSVVGDDVRTWEIVRDYLKERHWKLSRVLGGVQNARLHPFVDPAEIKNRKHQRLIELLIEQWLDRNSMTNDQIADEAGVGRSQFYAVRRRYMLYTAESKPESRTDDGL